KFMRTTATRRPWHPDEACKVSLAERVACAVALGSLLCAALTSTGCSKASASDPRTDPPAVVTTTAARAKASLRQFRALLQKIFRPVRTNFPQLSRLVALRDKLNAPKAK